MKKQPVIPSDSYYHHFPKVELHRHLEGSLRLETMMEIARQHGITLPVKPGLGALVQMQETDSLNFSTFLSKFQTIRLFYRSQDIIMRVTEEAVADAAADQVQLLELLFTPVALSRAQGYMLGEVMDWVLEAAAAAARKNGIRVLLIASFNRHEEVLLAEETARMAAERKDKGIVGLNLAGNEAEFSARPFAGVLAEARQAGLRITVHAGEWAGASNVREAIEDLGAERISHGVRVLEDETVVRLAAERGIAFEVCLTSNHQTGAVANLARHPLRKMLDAGLNVTLNTDDPSISRIRLTDEYRIACEELGLTHAELGRLVLAAGQASFLPGVEKRKLVNQLEQELLDFGLIPA
jgi:adenosine deaminase